METSELKRRLIERLQDSVTALVCNAYDFMGMHSPCTNWDIKCLTPEFPPMVGEAITISLDCSTPGDKVYYEAEESQDRPDGNLFYRLIERIEKSKVPSVVVVQSLGNFSYGAVAGDGMAKTMLAAGVAGFITNGAVRDLNDIKKAGLKTFGGGQTVNHHPLHWSGLGEPVVIGGLTIRTGDIIHGDTDGIITLPEAGWPKIVRACRYVADFEKLAHVICRRTEIGALEKGALVAALVADYVSAINGIQDFEEI